MRLIRSPNSVAVGLALEDQVLPPGHRLPIEAWDHPVDVVVHGGHVLLQQSSAR